MSTRQPPPRKRLGQHFLHDARVLDSIVESLGPLTGRTVVEIGPGRGALTDRLVARAERVIAIELDRDLAARLRVQHEANPQVEIVEADVLDVPIGIRAGGPYVLAGNVPYYITTPILFHALELPRPDVAVYLVQREVAERMAAPPGNKTYGALSVNLQAFVDVRLVRTVPPRAFTPPPTVDSAVVRVTPRASPLLTPDREAAFRTLVTRSFSLRRKQMVRVLRTITPYNAEACQALLRGCDLDPTARPETLAPADFARLAEALATVSAAGTPVGPPVVPPGVSPA